MLLRFTKTQTDGSLGLKLINFRSLTTRWISNSASNCSVSNRGEIPEWGLKNTKLLGLVCFLILTGLLVFTGMNSGAAQDESLKELEIVDSWFPQELADGLRSEGTYWLPVYLEIKANAGRSRTVTLRGKILRRNNEVFKLDRKIEINPGAARKIWTYLRYAGSGDDNEGVEVKIEVLNDDQVVLQRSWSFLAYSRNSFERPFNVVVAGPQVGHDVAASPWTLNTSHNRTPAGVAFRALAEKKKIIRTGGNEYGVGLKYLPDDPVGYHAIEELVIRGNPDSKLDPAQVDAILKWVYLGGRVYLVPSGGPEIFTSRFIQDVFPPELVGAIEQETDFEPRSFLQLNRGQLIEDKFELKSRLDSENEERAEAPRSQDKLKFIRIDPIRAEPLREIFSLSDVRLLDQDLEFVNSKRLYHEHAYGLGRIGILTIDDQAFSKKVGDPSRSFRQKLWGSILKGQPFSLAGHWKKGVSSYIDFSASQLLKEGLDSNLGVWFIGGLSFFYLLLVGPGLYFFLKRRDRLPAFVWIEPILVLIYVGLIFFTGTVTRGVLTQSRSLTVHRWKQGDTWIQKQAYKGLLSSRDSIYDIHAPGGSWLRPLFANANDENIASQKFSYEQSSENEKTQSLKNIPLDIWQVGIFNVSDLVQSKGSLTVRVVDDLSEDSLDKSPRLKVTVTNGSQYDLKSLFLVTEHGAKVIPLNGELDRGSDRTWTVSAKSSLHRETFNLRSKNIQDDEIHPFEDQPFLRQAIFDLTDHSRSNDLYNRNQLRLIGVWDRSETDIEMSPSPLSLHHVDFVLIYD